MIKDNENKNPSKKLETAKKIANKNRNVRSVYDGVEESILRVFRLLSAAIDRVFFSKRYLGVFALLLACVSYLTVNYDENSIGNALSSSKTLNNINVVTRYNSESFEVSGIPQACEIVLSGEAANVNNAISRNGYCLVNLEGYTEGTHSVNVSAVGYGDNVSVVTTPSEVQVTLKKKTTMQFDLSYDYINQNQLDKKYILGTPTFNNGTKINIRASQDTLNSISLVKALIDVSNQTGDFEIEAPLVAYDKNGQVIQADIVPGSVNVSVKIASPHKNVPINLVVSGMAPTGFAIDTVQMDHQTTEIYASEAVLASVSDVKANLDLSTLVGDTDIVSPIVLPNGVSSSDITMVNIKTTLAPISQRTIENVPIVYRNNDQGFAASEVDATSVNVTITGTERNIQNISVSDIVVYIDVKDCKEPGTYDLPLYIESANKNFVNFTADRLDINITLVNMGD